MTISGEEKEEKPKEEKPFCALCGKYVDGVLKKLQIGAINQPQAQPIGIIVDACDKCAIVIFNTQRIFGRAVQEFRSKVAQAEAAKNQIVVPGMVVPKNIFPFKKK
jgi:hypothetical protein